MYLIGETAIEILYDGKRYDEGFDDAWDRTVAFFEELADLMAKHEGDGLQIHTIPSEDEVAPPDVSVEQIDAGPGRPPIVVTYYE